MSLAPIVLFVYNRPEHTQKTVEALLKNALALDSNLIIFSDGAKNNDSVGKVMEVRNYIKTITGFKSLQLVEQDNNLGLSKSIIKGVSEVVSSCGKVIVLEDDLVTSPYFLTYMNKGLKMYEEEESVISIHGYVYPINLNTADKTFFLKGADCWGWATWKRGWNIFEENGQKLLNELNSRNLAKEFNFNNSYPYTQMLSDQINSKNDSWAIRWYASAFLLDKYTLYPVKSLVKNIGLDLSGTHSGKEMNFNDAQLSNDTFAQFNKIEIAENQEAKKSIELFFRKNNKKGFRQRIRNFIFKSG